MAASTSQEFSEKPWDLEPLFSYIGKNENKFNYKCNVCPIKGKEVSVTLKSRTNLRRHLETHKTKKISLNS